MWHTRLSELGSVCAQMLPSPRARPPPSIQSTHGHSQTHPWTRTVWECSVLQPGGPCGGSMETERPRLP